MKRFKYEYQTRDMAYPESFTVDEHSESIANVEAKLYVERHGGTAMSLTAFNLVCVQRAPT